MSGGGRRRRSTGPLLLVAVAALAALTAAPLAAQVTGSVRGTVVHGATLRPLGDAQVSVVGTGRGTVTAAAGDFLVVGVPPGEHTLRVQLLGFGEVERTVTVVAGETALVDVSLAPTAIELNELVVTGTPDATVRRSLGTSVARIDVGQVVDRAPIADVEELLHARTPGLTLMPGAGTVGTASDIRIRGAGSLNAGTLPIFYLDGVRIQASLGGDFGVLGQSRTPLDHLNPDDIETVEVIRGPAAATLYGAEAAAGVIHILTRKGLTGQQSVRWSLQAETGTSDWALPHPTSYKVCTPRMIGDLLDWPGCWGIDPNAPWQNRLITLNALRDQGQTIPLGVAGDTVSLPEALRTGRVEGYGLSVRGGGDRFSFYASGDHDFERGVFYNNWFRRQSGRANVQVVPVETLEASISLGFSRTASRLPLNDNASDGLLRNAYRAEPGRRGLWRYGYLNLSPDEINQWMNRAEDERLVFGTTIHHRPFPWLTQRVTLGLDKNDRLATETTPLDRTGRAPFGVIRARGYVQQARSENHNWTLDWAATGTARVTDRWSSATSAGLQLHARRYHLLHASGEGLASDRVNLLSSAATTEAGEERLAQGSVGFYLQELVGWRDVVYLTGAVRVDDHSAFGRDLGWAAYPKLSAAWVVSEEGWFDVSWVDDLKVRGAFGRAGKAPEPFAATRTFATTTATAEDGSSLAVVRPDALGNPDLRPERGHEIELGVDGGLLDNRLGLELTAYAKRTRDALLHVPAPPSSGFSGTVLENVGEISNSGVELAVWGTPLLGQDLTWDVRVAVAANRNRVVRLDRDPIRFGSFLPVQQHRDGYPLGGYWAWDVVRDAEGVPVLDAQGRARVAAADTTWIGPSAPTREVALANTVTLFGRLRLFASVDYKGGHWLWSAREWTRSFNHDISRWVNDPGLTEPERAAYRTGAPALFIDEADFVKLRELSLTWAVPGGLAGRIGARGASLTVAGRNLGIWTRYGLGSDPEVNFYGDETLSRADYMSVPMLRRLTVSLNLDF